jgi:excisionase family DNA binding protein
MDKKELSEYTLTTEEAAKIIGVSTSRLRRFASAGRLPALKRVGCWFFKPESVKDFKPNPSGRPAKKQ